MSPRHATAAIGLLALAMLALPRQLPAGEPADSHPDRAATTDAATSRHARLLAYRDPQGQEQPVANSEDWARRRQEIVAGFEQAAGPLPSREHLPDLDVQIVERHSADTFERLTLTFVAEGTERVPAILFLPKAPRGEKRAAILALHQTTPLGKAEPAGLGGKPNLQYALELAERGYVVLAPDYPSFGDYPYDFAAGRYVSGTMKGIFNHMRAIDLLAARDEVDPERIGVIGHSLGGHNAMFVALFDARIKAIVSSCGWTVFHDYYGGRLDGWAGKCYMPWLRDVYRLDPDRVPFDFDELVAALAPRPFFSNSPLHDDNFAVAGVRKGVRAAREVYSLLGAADNLQVRYPDCPHDFPPELRREAYAFLDAALKHAPPAGADLKLELPRIPPHEPADALSTFETAAGFELSLAAAEPLVASPVAMAFDERGRMFVVEMRDYSEQADDRLGRVRLLEDTDGDGTFDRATVFAQDLSWPTAVICYDGGVFVGAAPDIWYFKDTDGDGVADVRRRVFTGFGRGNVQGLLNSFQWGLDNRIHGAASTAGGLVRRPDEPADKALNLAGRDFSFDPRKLDLRAESGGGQHGMSFDDWGRKFVSSNSDHLQMILFDERYAARPGGAALPPPRVSIAADGPQAEVFRISPVEPWRIVRTRLRVAGQAPGPIEGGGRAAGYFTGATGATIYRGDAWPAEFRGQAFVGDVGSNIVHRKRLEPRGVEFVGRRIDDRSEFVASRDVWFRPAQFANGPDGNLYIVDVYREVIEHPLSLPPEIKRHLDLTSGRDRGRIYRVAPRGFVKGARPRLDGATIAELVAALAHPNGWTRDTAARLLFERADATAVTPLERLAAESQSALGRMHALYALAGLDALRPETLLARLADGDPRVREHAVRLAEPRAAGSAELRAALCRLASDDNDRVVFQLALTLGEFPADARDEAHQAALATILKRRAADPWIRSAVLASLGAKPGELFIQLIRDHHFRGDTQTAETLTALATAAGAAASDAELIELAARLDELSDDESPLGRQVVRALALGRTEKHPPRGTKLFPRATKSQRWLKEVLEAARQDAVDDRGDLATRQAAIESLRLEPLDESGPILARLISAREPDEVQKAALAVLRRHADTRVAQIVIGAWRTCSPAVRREAAEILFSREAWTLAVLEAVDKGTIPPGEIDPRRLALVKLSADPAIRQRGAEMVERLAVRPRQDVVEAYRAALDLDGDAARGKAVFQTNCAGCHRLENAGFEIGPNLATVQSRGVETILLNVLDPNREVNPQYVSYVVTTRDGRTATGMIASESAAAVTLRRAEDVTETIPRAEIEELRSTGMSLMPEGLERQIDTAAMADLLAYLMSVK